MVGLKAHPHMLRHALASAMAANKEPPASSPPSSATPTAARWPSGSTSTNSPRPPHGSPASSRASSDPRPGTRDRRRCSASRTGAESEVARAGRRNQAGTRLARTGPARLVPPRTRRQDIELMLDSLGQTGCLPTPGQRTMGPSTLSLSEFPSLLSRSS
jgi:hypothetical protein